MSDVLSKIQLAAMMQNYVDDVLDGAVVRLYTNELSISPETGVGEFVEPAGDWYEAAALTYSEVFEDDSGNISVSGGTAFFNYSGTDPEEVVQGYFCTSADGTVLYHAAALATPKSMGNDLDTVAVSPGFTLAAVTG